MEFHIKSKASVEGTIGKIASSIIAKLRNKRFISLSHVEEEVYKALKEFNDAELYKVTSYSYDKIPRTTYVPVACRNGGVYDVAVNWFEYIPCQKDSNVAFSKIKNNDNSNLNTNISNNSNINNNVVRYHNFASFFVGEDGFNENDANTFANEIKKYYNNK